MHFDRRTLFRLGAAVGASAVLPRMTRAVFNRHQVNPQYTLTGGASSDGAIVSSTLGGRDAHSETDLAVSLFPSMAEATLVGLAKADKNSIVRHTVTGQEADTTYYARVVSDGEMVGETVRFKTLPTGTTSWTRTIALVSCMTNAVDPICTELAWQDILDWGPDDVWHLGDWGYWGQEIPPDASYKKDLFQYLRSMRRLDTMRQAIQSAGLNVVTISDHELTINGDPKHGIHNAPETIRELVAFQKLMPIRTYGDTRDPRRGRYYTYDIGDQVRVIVTDFRSPDRSNDQDPDGPDKTMFGATQLAWLLDSFDSTKVNLLVNETSWLGDPNQRGRAHDKPWYYNYEQNIIADYITSGGYQVAWIGGDRHYVGYLAGQGDVSNTLGGFPCYIGSGMAKLSLDLQKGELMTWQFGAGEGENHPVCGYMRLTLSYDASSNEVTLSGLGRAVLDTTRPIKKWVMSDIPGGTATDTWKLPG